MVAEAAAQPGRLTQFWHWATNHREEAQIEAKASSELLPFTATPIVKAAFDMAKMPVEALISLLFQYKVGNNQAQQIQQRKKAMTNYQMEAWTEKGRTEMRKTATAEQGWATVGGMVSGLGLVVPGILNDSTLGKLSRIPRVGMWAAEKLGLRDRLRRDQMTKSIQQIVGGAPMMFQNFGKIAELNGSAESSVAQMRVQVFKSKTDAAAGAISEANHEMQRQMDGISGIMQKMGDVMQRIIGAAA